MAANRGRERGSGLIQTIMALTALGFIAVAYLNLQHNSIKNSSKIELRDVAGTSTSLIRQTIAVLPLGVAQFVAAEYKSIGANFCRMKLKQGAL
jgi:hypothetical protein